MSDSSSEKNSNTGRRLWLKLFRYGSIPFLCLLLVVGKLTYSRTRPHTEQTFSPELLKTMSLALARNEEQILKSKILELIDLKLKQHEADNISVYFEDLNTEAAIGIEEDLTYDSASLFKVPLMIAAYKKAESDPSFFTQRLEFQASACNLNRYHQTIVSTVALQDGQTYSVEELLYRLIVHSDNEALCPLQTVVVPDEFNAVLTKAGVPRTDPMKVGARQYGSLLLLLYRTAYVSPEMSARALRLLSRSEFHDGLAAGVPAAVAVSHKFGEWGEHGKSQFHDCGIVFHPTSPYLLCLMTKGNNLEHLIPIIADISRVTYAWVSSRAHKGDDKSGPGRRDSEKSPVSKN